MAGRSGRQEWQTGVTGRRDRRSDIKEWETGVTGVKGRNGRQSDRRNDRKEWQIRGGMVAEWVGKVYEGWNGR